jgi:hypothetical protein
VIGAALALIGAIIGRAVGIIPNPFGGGGPEPSGSVQIGETLRNQTLAMFHHTETTQRPGEMVGIGLAVQRFSDHTPAHGCRLVWSFIDPNAPAEVGDKSLVNQTARDVVGDPTACEGGAKIWVPLKPSLGIYDVVRVRVELFDGDKQLGIPVETEDITLG